MRSSDERGTEGGLADGWGTEGGLMVGWGTEGGLVDGWGTEGVLVDGWGTEGVLVDGWGTEGGLMDGCGCTRQILRFVSEEDLLWFPAEDGSAAHKLERDVLPSECLAMWCRGAEAFGWDFEPLSREGIRKMLLSPLGREDLPFGLGLSLSLVDSFCLSRVAVMRITLDLRSLLFHFSIASAMGAGVGPRKGLGGGAPLI